MWAILFVLPAVRLLLLESFQRGQGKALRGPGSLADPYNSQMLSLEKLLAFRTRSAMVPQESPFSGSTWGGPPAAFSFALSFRGGHQTRERSRSLLNSGRRQALSAARRAVSFSARRS